MEIDEHIGCAMSGLVADAKMLVDHARAETQVGAMQTLSLRIARIYLMQYIAAPQQHRFSYNEAMPLESVTQSLCDLALRFGEDSEEGGLVSYCVCVRVYHQCEQSLTNC
jgi:20S proteasome subunit alpha 5